MQSASPVCRPNTDPSARPYFSAIFTAASRLMYSSGIFSLPPVPCVDCFKPESVFTPRLRNMAFGAGTQIPFCESVMVFGYDRFPAAERARFQFSHGLPPLAKAHSLPSLPPGLRIPPLFCPRPFSSAAASRTGRSPACPLPHRRLSSSVALPSAPSLHGSGSCR